MKITRKLTQITPTRAQELLRLNTYKAQRKLKPKRVARLGQRINDGTFHTGHIGVYVMPNGGGKLLVDGQHQCQAVINAGKPIMAVVATFVPETPIEQSPEGLAGLYAQFNEGGLRTRTDIIKTYVHALGLEISAHQGCKIATALANLEWGSRGSGRTNASDKSKDELGELLGKHPKDVESLRQICWGTNSNTIWFIQRGSVMAAMVETLRVNRKDAHEFWEQVRDGELLKRSDPAYRLRSFLQTVNMHEKTQKTKFAGHKEVYAKCIYAWNAYRAKTTIKNLKYTPGHKLPKAK